MLELRRQLDPDDTLLVPFALEVLAAPVPVVSLRRSTIRRRGRVRVENPNDESIRVALTGSVNGAAFRFDPTVLDLGPGASGRARLRVVSKGRFGRRPATVGAATANSAASVDAVVVGRSRSWPFLATFVAVAAFVSSVGFGLLSGRWGADLAYLLMGLGLAVAVGAAVTLVRRSTTPAVLP